METEERASRWANGSNYNEYIQGEFNSFRKQAWKDQINKRITFKGRGLDILDIGTGPGFFSCILSEEGHNVTGIDQSPGMLECAEENAERLNVHPKFIRVDVNEIDTSNDYDDLKAKAYLLGSENLAQRIEDIWINKSEMDIYVAGGTSINLEFDEEFKRVEDAQLATAKGLFEVAKIKF